MTAGAQEVDGRRLRREQNRQAVLEALVDLFEEGSLLPSAAEIAERAGLSPRSLFRYFDDIDDLNRAAIARELRRAEPLVEHGAAPGDPTEAKVERIVASRVDLFETIAPAARAARVSAPRRPVLATQLRQGREFLREQLRDLFAPELRDRPHLLPAVDALLSFEVHELLRHDQRLDREDAAAALRASLITLLRGEP